MANVSRYTLSYESHPGKPLITHTENVYNRARIMHNSPIVFVGSKNHDIGKLNPNFRAHLAGQIPAGVALYKNHAYLSFYATLIWIYNNKAEYLTHLKTNDNLISTLVCIIKHHGSLPNLDELINVEEWDRMVTFLKTNPMIPADELITYFGMNDATFDICSPTYINMCPSLKNACNCKVQEPLNFYFETRMSFSALICGDKGDAVGYVHEKRIFDRFSKKYSSQLSKYINKLSTNSTPLNTVRTAIRNYTSDRLKIELPKGTRVFCLTAPTGSGKTLIMLNASKVIKEYAGNNYKVIYAIPFLSITEQVFDICSKVFGQTKEGLKRIDSKSEIVEEESLSKSKLHLLVSKVYKFLGLKTKDALNIDKLLNEEFLESTFDYPLIVTTFVQLFEAYTTHSNKGLMKLCNMKNSILLVDEMQVLPPRLYTFFTAVLDEFCRRYNSYAIISTATMPCFDITDKNAIALFKGYTKPTELSDYAFYDSPVFNRYEIQVLSPARHTTLSISHEIIKETKSCLVILNTVRDSRDVYSIIKKSGYDGEVLLLNSNFYSDARLKIITRCKELLASGQKVILVSTQLIEAGVDIDFPLAYRDIAPLPNIIQSSGRVNRNGSLINGVIKLFILYDENGDRAKTIYNGLDSPLLEHAYNIFFNSSIGAFQEKDLLPLQMSFFKQIASGSKFGYWKVKKDEYDFINLINKQKFGDIGNFRVIPPERYGAQYHFYIPDSDKDEKFEQLIAMYVDMAIEEENPNNYKDKLRHMLFLKRKLKNHFKLMSKRIVQASLSENIDIGMFVEYPQEYMHTYKLKPEYYDENLGLLIKE